MPDRFGSRPRSSSCKPPQVKRSFSSRRDAAGDEERRLSPHEQRELFGDVEIDRALYPSPPRTPPSPSAAPPRREAIFRPVTSALRLRSRLRPLLAPPRHHPTAAVPCSATSPPTPPLPPPPPPPQRPPSPSSHRAVTAAAAAAALPSRQQLCARLPSPPRGLWHRVWALLGPRAERWAAPAGAGSGSPLGAERTLSDFSGAMAPGHEYFRSLPPEEYAQTPFTYSERREFSDPITGTRAVGMVVEGKGDRPTHIHVTFSDTLVELPSHSKEEGLADSSKTTHIIMDPKFHSKDGTCSNLLNSSCTSFDTQQEEELGEDSGSITNVLRSPVTQGPHEWCEFVADLDQEERLREYDMEEVDDFGWFC